jgi:hypothetical protein
MFQRMVGIQLMHIHYRGDPIPDVIGGQVDCLIGPVQSALESSGPASCMRSA